MSCLDDPEVFRSVLTGLQTGVCVTDCQGKILFWNNGAERITGYKSHEVIGHSCRQSILSGCTEQNCGLCGEICPVAETVRQGKAKEGRIHFHHHAGHRMPVHVWMVPIRDQYGAMIAIAQSFDKSATSDRDRRETSLAECGCLDETTGIPHHEFTLFRLRENLDSFEKYHLPFGILRIKVEHIDHFRAAYGREAIDTILSLVARTVGNSLRPADFFGRWTEDQFLAIAVNCNRMGMEAIVRRIGNIVSCEGMRWWGDELQVTACIGHATAQPGDTLESLLERAERSLYETSAKHSPASASATSSSRSRN